MPLMNKQVAKAIYDFGVDGTAAGDIALAKTETLPVGAVITNIYTNETTPVAGSTDIDIMVGTTDVVVTAVDFTGDAGFQARTVALNLLTTGGSIQVYNDGSAVTAGVVEIFIEYMY